ncbi:nitroreductase family protein [Actinacidiphila yeochonensis]|uniref:nitroreductase family protein n=1 Tax=Actinacidiphila yeochonensis TaxID=89050 RepID=UPI00055D40B0|nr:nitroreductase family protein [Actinacidiphila yeochonensis]
MLDLSPDQLLSTTRAVRRRLDLTRPVSRELLEECLALATQAPSGRNRQRWEFVIVTDAGLRAGLADLYRLGLTHPTQHISDDGVDRAAGTASRQRGMASGRHLFEHLHEVPVMVVPCVRSVRSAQPPSVVEQANTWGSILPAVWSFMLAARSRGLGTAWTTPHLHYEEKAAELLGIDYQEVQQAALIPLAHTVGTDFRPGPRADLDQVVHWDRW